MEAGDFDVAVIGRGMVGSAAARHLAEVGQSVVLIGAGEAPDYQSSTGPFASHYDEGRITRISDPTALWAELAARSTQRYGDIAERSGIDFHTPCGLASVTRQPELLLQHAEAHGGQARLVDRDWLRSETGISISDELPGEVILEGAPAGHINPRRLVEAQSALTTLAGGTIVEAPATSITSTSTGFAVATEHGDVLASKILLATGAYAAGLVGIDLAIELRLRTIVLAELGPGTEIPSLIVERVKHPGVEGVYWVPPLAFPDGRTLLKIGGTGLPTLIADDEAEITEWFHQGGSKDEAAALESTVRDLLPDAKVTFWDHKPCVITVTTTGRPYIGFVADGVAVAVGGNGSAAKSCDEIGHLAASLFSPTGWAGNGLAQEEFSPVLPS